MPPWRINAANAAHWGIVSSLHPADALIDEAVKVASTISKHSQLIIRLAKSAVNVANETTLSSGIELERKLFHSTFGTADQKEGMNAFIAKRKPNFTNR